MLSPNQACLTRAMLSSERSDCKYHSFTIQSAIHRWAPNAGLQAKPPQKMYKWGTVDGDLQAAIFTVDSYEQLRLQDFQPGGRCKTTCKFNTARGSQETNHRHRHSKRNLQGHSKTLKASGATTFARESRAGLPKTSMAASFETSAAAVGASKKDQCDVAQRPRPKAHRAIYIM